MPIVPFETLPDDARIWVFGSDRPIEGERERTLLRTVDEFLAGWKAHGFPLSSARAWRDRHFLMIAVDQRDEAASGCSIDGLFRALRALEPELEATLTPGGMVYFRAPDGGVVVASRDTFQALAARGDVTGATPVFDPTVATLGEWRTRFEGPASNSWHSKLLAKTAGSGESAAR